MSLCTCKGRVKVERHRWMYVCVGSEKGDFLGAGRCLVSCEDSLQWN